MTTRYRIPDGSRLELRADQWYEEGYVIRGNHICFYSEDRKDPTSYESSGEPLEMFLARSTADEKVKQWVRDLIRTHAQ